MKIEYSAAVEIALRRALVHAREAGSAQVEPSALLRGLLDEEEGQAAVLLQAAGIQLDTLREILAPAVSPHAEASSASRDSLPLASLTADSLAHARELARVHGAEGSVSSELLLLAILEKDEATRARLEKAGVDFAALQNRVTPPAPLLRLEQPLDLTSDPGAVDAARIVDASANRAREALRVLEDFARFVRGDAFLCAQLKNLRHQLAEALEQLPANILLGARDTLHDVGTGISTTREQERGSPLDVARANAKRLQEALRSLEEFGKVLSPLLGMAVEQLRYHSYTLERALLAGADPRGQLAEAKLYVLVTEGLCRASLVGTVREALAGGAQVVQLREKSMEDRALLEAARDLRKMTRSAGALFIVNDRLDIALLAEADGVHLGQTDVRPQEARRVLGAGAIVGVSTHNLEQVEAAVLEGANYLGVGPTFPSKTKDFTALPGLDFVRQVAATTALPAFVLGGVGPDNIKDVMAAGGTRVAVSHAICAAEDPKGVAARMRRLLEGK